MKVKPSVKKICDKCRAIHDKRMKSYIKEQLDLEA